MDFWRRKWFPPEIQECDLYQGNICGVRCTSLWSMINGHTTPIFVENSQERPFSIIPRRLTLMDFWRRNGLHQKSKIEIYGKETYVGWGTGVFGQWSMAMQPPFFSTIATNEHFQLYRSLKPMDFLQRNGLHQKSKNVIYGKETYVWSGIGASGRWSMAIQPPFLLK
jgi:hypothetical protein